MGWLAALSALLCAATIPGCNRSGQDAAPLYAGLERGEYDKVLTAAERKRRAAESSGDRAAAAKFKLVVCEALMQRGSANEALDCLSAIPESSAGGELMARREMLRAQATIKKAQFPQAAASIEKAYRLARESGAKHLLPRIAVTEGSLRVNLRDWDGAERILVSALEDAHAANLPFEESGALLNLGASRLRRARYDDAAGYFERAAALSGSRMPVLFAAAQSNLAICYYQLGEFDRGIELHRQAIERDERAGARQYLGEALGEAGSGYILKGEPERAIPYLQRARAIAQEVHRDDNAAVWAGNLSLAFADLGKWDEAERLNQEALRLKEAGNRQTRVHNMLYAAGIALGRGNTGEANRLFREALGNNQAPPAVRWNAYGGLGNVAMAQHRPKEASEYYEKAIGVVETTRSGLQDAFKLTFFGRLIHVYRQYVEALIVQKRTEEAWAVADGSRAQLLAIRSGVAAGARLAPDAFRRIAAERNAVILSYWLAPERSYVWVATKQTVACFPIGPAAKIEAAVAGYRKAIEESLADPVRSAVPEGVELFRLLVEPALGHLPRGASVVIVPDGVLHGLNFETLLNPDSGAHYWIEDVSVSIVPSLRLLKARVPRSATPLDLLLLGDPVSGDPAYPALQYAPQEIESVVRQFPRDRLLVYRGAAATPAAYRRSAPDQFSILHFSAHAVANRQSPLDSAVLLSGGKLYARDVMECRLKASLVTISACRGAGARAYSGEGMVGFAWAFLSAGAENVIAGLWDVDDRSTATLMDALYRELAAGKSEAAALHAAKLSLLHSSGNFRKPYYWAPFQLYTLTL